MDERQWARNLLQPYEQILWTGKPEKGHLLTSADVFMIPFSIFWCGFAFFWEFSVLRSGVFAFGIFGIPFVLIGLYITVGRFIHNAWLRKNTSYAITNQRLLRRQGNRIDTQPIAKAKDVHADLRADGTGDLIFVMPRVLFGGYYSSVNMSWFPGMSNSFCFRNIADANRVSRIAADAAAQAR